MEIAAKKIEEMEKSLWGEHGQRRQPGNNSSFKRLMFKALMKDDYRYSLFFGS
jgi:hypothetical protein